uniref:Uncharacterized protein n=1 Tax=Oryza sativa subsp. japonica TaxID=39947 RepID=Q69SB2_ORYSJ|nr:hypothetical protein [Oryza sativa Japonica Group]BAD30855.1 hypothetical protein [Oryza sativa Japonica Group]
MEIARGRPQSDDASDQIAPLNDSALCCSVPSGRPRGAREDRTGPRGTGRVDVTCQCARVVRLVSIVARYARRETDDGCATRSRSRVGVNRVKLPPSALARAKVKRSW